MPYSASPNVGTSPWPRWPWRWVLHNPVVSSSIVGATKEHHLADAAALHVQPTHDELTALEEHFTPRTPTYYGGKHPYGG